MYESFHEESMSHKNDSKWFKMNHEMFFHDFLFNISCCPRIACSYLIHVLSYRFRNHQLKIRLTLHVPWIRLYLFFLEQKLVTVWWMRVFPLTTSTAQWRLLVRLLLPRRQWKSRWPRSRMKLRISYFLYFYNFLWFSMFKFTRLK